MIASHKAYAHIREPPLKAMHSTGQPSRALVVGDTIANRVDVPLCQGQFAVWCFDLLQLYPIDGLLSVSSSIFLLSALPFLFSNGYVASLVG